MGADYTEVLGLHVESMNCRLEALIPLFILVNGILEGLRNKGRLKGEGKACHGLSQVELLALSGWLQSSFLQSHEFCLCFWPRGYNTKEPQTHTVSSDLSPWLHRPCSRDLHYMYACEADSCSHYV